jgi:16S rRNA (guanine(966)-N(2))-methyltransferase RsmD
MRITGGQVKGRRLAAFKGLDIRPTSDMVRKAIFDLIGHNLEGLKVLDLFAGTGSLGIEALSRGASRAVFADQSQKSIDLIQRNLKICGLEGEGIVWKGNLVQRFPGKRLLGEKGVDLVFIDPYERPGDTDHLWDFSKGDSRSLCPDCRRNAENRNPACGG